MHILVINSGSSSIKFSIFDAGSGPASGSGQPHPRALYTGEISRIGSPNLAFTFRNVAGNPVTPDSVKPGTQTDPLQLLVDAVAARGMPAIDAVGYRVVHPGALLHKHQRITAAMLRDLEEAVDFAPLHNPEALRLIRDLMRRFPRARHYACFDTVFHQTMPAAASTYAIPAEYRRRGVRRYGFHGLSCESAVDTLRAAARRDHAAFPARMVIAHLGSGCSVTALIGGRSVDTSMGLTPTGGVVMGTRPGDLDPGLILYLLRHAEDEKGRDRTTALDSIEAVLNHKSGMVALSGLPNDMRTVRKAQQSNEDARLAIEVFTRSVRKAIGSYAWLLGGLDAIVFTGGIGEHDGKSRSEILEGLEACGVMLDAASDSAAGAELRRISKADSQVAVWVIPAEEDRMIAVHVGQMETTGTTEIRLPAQQRG